MYSTCMDEGDEGVLRMFTLLMLIFSGMGAGQSLVMIKRSHFA